MVFLLFKTVHINNPFNYERLLNKPISNIRINFTALVLNGTWATTYLGAQDKATYTIDGSKVKVVWCSWANCKTITQSTIIPTDDEVTYTAVQGWKKIPEIHESGKFMYVRVNGHGRLDVNYDNKNGIGIKRTLPLIIIVSSIIIRQF